MQTLPLRAPQRPWLSALACAGVIIAIAVMHAAFWMLNPSMTAGNNGNDLIFLADGARHMAAGQWLHADISLPTGVLPYVLYWLAGVMLPAMPAFMAMHLLAFLLIAPLLIAGAVHLPNSWMRLCLIGAVSIIALLPFNTAGIGFCGTDMHASYNRFGAALSLAYLAWIYRAGNRPWLDRSLLAWAILLVFFLKIVYLAVIFAPLAVFVLFDARWRRIALQSLLVVLIILAAIQVTTGEIGAYLADIRAMSAVNGGRAIYFVFSFIYKFVFELALAAGLIVALLAHIWVRRPETSNWRQSLAAVAQPLAMAAGLLGIVIAESQSTGGMGVSAALALLIVPALWTAMPSRTLTILTVAFTAFVGGTLVVNAFEKGMCNLLQRQGQAVPYDWAERLVPHLRVPEAAATAAASMVTVWENRTPAQQSALENTLAFPDDISAMLYLAQWISVDHAIKTLEANGEIGDLGRTTTLAFVDFFGFALNAMPAKNMKNVIDIGRTMALPDDAGASAYLENVDTAFVPACGLSETAKRDQDSPWLSQAYAQTLAASFTSTPLTTCWTMYRRNTNQ